MKKINYRAPCNTLGMGIFSTIYYKHMLEAGYDVAWKVISKNRDAQEEARVCTQFNVNVDKFIQDTHKSFHRDLPVFSIWHAHDLLRDTEGLPVRALIHFESDGFTQQEFDCLCKVDRLSCCSNWGARSIISSGCTNNRVLVAPGIFATHEIDDSSYACSVFNSAKKQLKSIGYDILLVSNGKWEKRKQQFRFLQDDFCQDYNTLVIGLWSNPFLGGLKEPDAALKKAGFFPSLRVELPYKIEATIYKGPNKIDIMLCPFIEDFARMQQFTAGITDAFASISAGEGWDQPLTEAMGMNIPCLATYNTAHTEYLNKDRAYLVKCSEELAHDDIWFNSNKGNWFPPIMDSLNQKYTELAEDIINCSPSDSYDNLIMKCDATREYVLLYMNMYQNRFEHYMRSFYFNEC